MYSQMLVDLCDLNQIKGYLDDKDELVIEEVKKKQEILMLNLTSPEKVHLGVTATDQEFQLSIVIRSMSLDHSILQQELARKLESLQDNGEQLFQADTYDTPVKRRLKYKAMYNEMPERTTRLVHYFTIKGHDPKNVRLEQYLGEFSKTINTVKIDELMGNRLVYQIVHSLNNPALTQDPLYTPLDSLTYTYGFEFSVNSKCSSCENPEGRMMMHIMPCDYEVFRVEVGVVANPKYSHIKPATKGHSFQ